MAKKAKDTSKETVKKDSAPKDAKSNKEALNYDQYWSKK